MKGYIFISTCCHENVINSGLTEGLDICIKCSCVCDYITLDDTNMMSDENANLYWEKLSQEDRNRLAKKVARHPEDISIFDKKLAIEELYFEGQINSFLGLDEE